MPNVKCFFCTSPLAQCSLNNLMWVLTLGSVGSSVILQLLEGPGSAGQAGGPPAGAPTSP